METDLDKETARIADAIVELVERTDGPVTLARVEKEISGFAKHEPPSWQHVVRQRRSGREISFWGGMTEAGLAALHKVMRERRVAIQFVNVLPYFMEGCTIESEEWQPIVLLPASAANVDTQNWHLRVSQELYDHFAKQIAEGKTHPRLLTPQYDGATADFFFGVNTGEDVERAA
jgi:hypothetical protein